MISAEDCIAMCGLDADGVAAIAEHEHIPEIAAAVLANYLLHRTGGTREIRHMLVDDIRAALGQGDETHAAELFSALRHFLDQHPDGKAAKG